MKKYIIIVLLIYCNQYVNSQNTWQRDSAMYMTAYTYILNDSINQKKNLLVADSLVDLDCIYNEDTLNTKEENEILLRQKKKHKYLPPYHSSLLSNLFPKIDISSEFHVIFFSPIIENVMLRADLYFLQKKNINMKDIFRYDSYIFGTSYQYLFIFQPNSTLKRVICNEFILN